VGVPHAFALQLLPEGLPFIKGPGRPGEIRPLTTLIVTRRDPLRHDSFHLDKYESGGGGLITGWPDHFKNFCTALNLAQRRRGDGRGCTGWGRMQEIRGRPMRALGCGGGGCERERLKSKSAAGHSQTVACPSLKRTGRRRRKKDHLFPLPKPFRLDGNPILVETRRSGARREDGPISCWEKTTWRLTISPAPW